MRYYDAKCEEYYEQFAYRNYVCDSLYLNGQNKAFDKRFYDILNDVEMASGEPERAPEEIAEDIMTRMGLKFE